MDRVTHYQHLVEEVLTQYLELNYANGDIQNEPIFNHETGQYVVMSSGWQGVRRIHGCLLHVKIQDGKVWIERDGTEHGIANEFVAAGIPRDAIVLGFYSRAARQHTDFAVA
jgi:hypothetical protein